MKTLFLAFVILLATGLFNPIVAAEKVRIGTQGTFLEQGYQKIFETLYEEKGFEIQWIQVPVERAWLEVMSGNLDASLFIDQYAAAQQKTGFFVFPELFDFDLIVICSAAVTCDKGALYDENAIFIGPSIAEGVREQFGFSFRFEQVEDVKNYLKMIVSARYDFAIALGNEDAYLELQKHNVKYFKVEKIKMYHYISPNRDDIYSALTAGG